MRSAGDDSRRLAMVFLRVSGVSLLAISALAADALAGERLSATGHGARCASAGGDYAAIQGGDGCFKVGDHVRVEPPVMQGSARLSGNLPGDAGVAPAGLRSDGAMTRLRMRAMPGDILAR